MSNALEALMEAGNWTGTTDGRAGGAEDKVVDDGGAGRHCLFMIVCNRCGERNEDEVLFCASCGHKLQSARRGDGRGRESQLIEEHIPSLFWAALGRGASLPRFIEAWAYALTLGGLAYWCVWSRIWWPLYAAGPLVAALAWFRKL